MNIKEANERKKLPIKYSDIFEFNKSFTSGLTVYLFFNQYEIIIIIQRQQAGGYKRILRPGDFGA